jgi:hypothetical protein
VGLGQLTPEAAGQLVDVLATWEAVSPEQIARWLSLLSESIGLGDLSADGARALADLIAKEPSGPTDAGKVMTRLIANVPLDQKVAMAFARWLQRTTGETASA